MNDSQKSNNVCWQLMLCLNVPCQGCQKKDLKSQWWHIYAWPHLCALFSFINFSFMKFALKCALAMFDIVCTDKALSFREAGMRIIAIVHQPGEDSFFCFHLVNNRRFCQEELSNPQHWFLILLNCVPACSTPSLWRIYNHILVTIKNCPIFLKIQKHFRPCELLQQFSHMSIPPLWRSKDRSWSWNLANWYQTSLKCMR